MEAKREHKEGARERRERRRRAEARLRFTLVRDGMFLAAHRGGPREADISPHSFYPCCKLRSNDDWNPSFACVQPHSLANSARPSLTLDTLRILHCSRGSPKPHFSLFPGFVKGAESAESDHNRGFSDGLTS